MKEEQTTERKRAWPRGRSAARDRPPKVCFDLTTLLGNSRFRGIGQYCQELVRAFARADPRRWGLDVHLLLGPPSDLRILPLAQGLDRLQTFFEGTPVLSDVPYFMLKHTVARALLARAGMDLYHSPEPIGTPGFPHCRTLVTCHDLIPIVLDYPYHPPVLPRQWRKVVARVRFRMVEHIIVISRCTAQDLERIAKVPAERMSLVYQGMNLERFSPDQQPGEREAVAAMLGTERPFFLYVGGFDARRQVPQMAEAFAARAQEMEQVLVICGEMPRPAKEDLQRRIRSLPGRDRILVAGFVPPSRLPALYRQATAHVMLSIYEGFGLTVLEAFACGCPVIARRASCVPEIAEDAALLLDPDDRAAPGEAMVRLAADEGLRQKLRQRGLKRAARFNWDRCAEETLGVYARVLQD